MDTVKPINNMTRTTSLLGAILLFLIAFIFIRSFVAGIKIYQLNKSAYKKIRKQESFKDWLCYTKYKGVIPKIILILYWVVVISHSLGIVLSIVLWFMENPEEIIRKVLKILLYFDGIWYLIIQILFWSPSKPFGAYDRWIKKKKGQPPKK